MKYYLIHGGVQERRIFMENQIAKFDIPYADVTWILEPTSISDVPENICRDKNLKHQNQHNDLFHQPNNHMTFGYVQN